MRKLDIINLRRKKVCSLIHIFFVQQIDRLALTVDRSVKDDTVIGLVWNFGVARTNATICSTKAQGTIFLTQDSHARK